jgi:hypothetical protein
MVLPGRAQDVQGSVGLPDFPSKAHQVLLQDKIAIVIDLTKFSQINLSIKLFAV